MLCWIVNRSEIGVMVNHDIGRGEFVFHKVFFPETHSWKDFSAEFCYTSIRNATLPWLKDIELQHVNTWEIDAEAAPGYIDKDNRCVAIAGDAAHLLPPTGGFGMNCGIGDVENLAFKIAETEQRNDRSSAAQLRRAREQKMLEYNEERQRIGGLTVELAMNLFSRVLESLRKSDLSYKFERNFQKSVELVEKRVGSDMSRANSWIKKIS